MRAKFQAVAVAVVAVVACGLVSGCSDTRFESPDSTLETAKVAFADHNYDQFCDCLTDDSRDQIAASMVFGFMQVAAEGNDDQQGEAKEIKAVLAKHGLNEKNQPKVAFDPNASDKEKKEQVKKLVEPIKDRDAFIVDMFTVIQKHSEKPNEKPFEADAKLTDLKIDGQVATAKVVQTRGGKEESFRIKFAKSGSNWKIDEFQFN